MLLQASTTLCLPVAEKYPESIPETPAIKTAGAYSTMSCLVPAKPAPSTSEKSRPGKIQMHTTASRLNAKQALATLSASPAYFAAFCWLAILASNTGEMPVIMISTDSMSDTAEE